MINWWEFSRKGTYCYLEKEGRDIIKKRIQDKNLTVKEANEHFNVNYSTLLHWLYDKSRNINVKSLSKICDVLSIEKSVLDALVTSINIKAHHLDANFKFPIAEKPEHIQIITHIMCDGSYAGPSEQMIYWDQEIETQKYFLDLIERAFPGLTMQRHYIGKDFITVPSAIAYALMKHYNITTFHSKKCFYPRELKNRILKDKKLANAVISAAFLDEGSAVCDSVFIIKGVMNKQFANDINDVCKSINLETKIKKTADRGFNILLRSESKKLAWESFGKDLPICRKSKKFESYTKRTRNCKKKNLENEVLTITKRETKVTPTIISEELSISYRRACYYLSKLVYNKKIEKLGKIGSKVFYGFE